MSEPKRIQRKRSKGWKMPEGAIYVGRPTKWGNPWTTKAYWNAGYSGDARVAVEACVEMFRAWVTQTCSSWSGMVPCEDTRDPSGRMRKPSDVTLAELRGKDLACWCPLDQPCHADVLLELANS